MRQVLEEVKVSCEMNRETLLQVASTSLRTKLSQKVADIVTEVWWRPRVSYTSEVCVCVSLTDSGGRCAGREERE